MKRTLAVLTLVAVVALSLPAFAGGDPCTGTTQECLDKMAAKLAMKGWAGFEGEYNDESHVYTLTSVVPESPAAVAGFRAGDEVFAWNGNNFGDMSEEDWGKTAEKRTPGNEATYTFYRNGEKDKLTLTYVEMPQDVQYEMIGKHMAGHAQVADATVQ